MVLLRCKVAVVGDPTVGKTAMCQLFDDPAAQFPKNYIMTQGVNMKVKTVKIPETKDSVELCVYDTGTNDIYRKLWQDYVINSRIWKGSSMVMVVFNVADRATFSNCRRWIEEYKKAVAPIEVKGALVGAKSDLKEHSQITLEEAKGFAEQHQLRYFEVSALNAKDVDTPFNFIASYAHQNYRAYCKGVALSGDGVPL